MIDLMTGMQLQRRAREHVNNEEDQAGVLGPTSTLIIQIHKGFEAPLRNWTTSSVCSVNLLQVS